MSVQHRSRIRTVADYSADFSDIGSCCYPPGHENYNIEDPTIPIDDISYQECVENGGYFLPSGGVCPNLSSQGCCCACSIVPIEERDDFLDDPGPNYGEGCPDNDPLLCYQGGLEEMTLCECNSLGGMWTITPCSVFYDSDSQTGIGSYVLCDPTEEGVPDVRFPGACCSENIEGNCANACSVEECASLIGDDEDAIYYENDTCNDYLPECGNSSGGDGVKRYRRYPNIIIGEELKKMRDSDKSNEKSCCIYKEDSHVLCKRTVKSECERIGGMYGGLDKNSQSLQCTDSTCTDIENYIGNYRRSIDKNVVSNWSVGQKVLNLGVYAGDFHVKSRVHPSSPTIHGNLETGYSQPYKPATVEYNKNSEEKYAIILYPIDIFNVQHNSSDIKLTKNSSWDSLSNNNNRLDLVKQIKTMDNNPWLIPSVDLMGFIYNQIDTSEFITNTTVNDENPLLRFRRPKFKQFYWTSSIVKETGHFYIHRGDFVAACNATTRHHVRLVMTLKHS